MSEQENRIRTPLELAQEATLKFNQDHRIHELGLGCISVEEKLAVAREALNRIDREGCCTNVNVCSCHHDFREIACDALEKIK